MKKILTIVCAFALCLSLCGCAGCSLAYDYEVDKGFIFGTNKLANCCFVGDFTPNGDERVVKIPDEYTGVRITRIGGYFGRGVPAPFCIDLAREYPTAKIYSSYLFTPEPEFEMVEIEFTIYIGKNISHIEYVEDEYYFVEEDGKGSYYHPVVYIECSDENDHFYSKNGKLYDKFTDELIEDFSYSEK